MINVYRRILQTEEEIEKCEKILRGFGWRFGFKSSIKEDAKGDPNYMENIPFWKLPLDNEPFFAEHMFDVIKERTEMNFEILEVYCNGQTYGQDGYPHVDNVHGETHTFLYYANKDWNLTHGGSTIFIGDKEQTIVDPYPNSAVMFTTDHMHYGEAYNQFCRDLRMTVCYKLKEL